MRKILITFVLLCSIIQLSNAQTTKNKAAKSVLKSDSVWMLSYFRQRYPTRIEINDKGETVEVPLPDPMLSAKLHIALSADGRHWNALNGNKPIWDQFMRDQYLHRGVDGLWRLIATGGAGAEERKKSGPSVTYATSKDLVHWKFEKYIPLMKDVKDESGEFVGNIWAPEFYFDAATEEYTIFWSSTFKDAGWKESRLWYCKTKDWETFSPAKVMFAPAYSVIDGTITKHKDVYYLFHKEEEFGAKTGERRGIRLATSKNIEGPYEIYNGPLNKGQIAPTITEGPSIMKDPVKKGWLLLYDYPMVDQYGISSSPDFFTWKIEKDVSMPDDARHGSVSKISAEEADRLLTAFP
ncbi:glycoside hydrolase family 43 protein [Pedobacter sp. BAL39]|uniref:glycoside hydrolase family 43 protein n=1 Tax=Pedobacter sp. BAL39 TaxID=391596 RepID=UPI001E51E849|nr:glycoside hydrolase family 43 protein [Pedobacter sp. BAL39]